MKYRSRVSDAEKADIQLLFTYGVKASAIAKHFKVSAPTISYHTIPVEPKSVANILLELRRL